MAKIINIINNNKVFGFGQISHEPREYFTAPNGAEIGSILRYKDPDAIIETEMFNVEVREERFFYLTITTKDGWSIAVEKALLNTASPECCVKAAEEQLRLLECQKSPAATLLETRRKAAQLSRAELARESGVHIQLITKFERKERDIENASYKTVVKLAQALQCTPDRLVYRG